MVSSVASFRQPPPPSALTSLTQENAEYIANAANLAPAEPFKRVDGLTQAAVAVILYESERLWDGKDGADPSLQLDKPRLQVLMTTRALHLRSHPGQSSLPGGKIDRTDSCAEEAALRESEEEVGLDRSLFGESLFWVQTREPFISKTCLLVHPVIFYLSNPEAILPKLVPCPTEVSSIWSFPLEFFLQSELPASLTSLPLSDPALVDTHRKPQTAFRTYSDVPWLNNQKYRLHRFRTHRQLIKGLTADILIDAAQVACKRPAAYTLYAPDQPPWKTWAQFVISSSNDRSKRQARWGDGESGDLLTSAHAFETVIGVDDVQAQANGA